MSIAARAAVNDAFAGIDGSAVVVIAVVALINTIRRFDLHLDRVGVRLQCCQRRGRSIEGGQSRLSAQTSNQRLAGTNARELHRHSLDAERAARARANARERRRR